MYPTEQEIAGQRARIATIRALGTPQAQADAEALQAAFHDEQMNVLSKDVYWSAMGSAAPTEGRRAPQGWLRASEHLDLLRQAAPGLAGMTDGVLREYLRPKDSGFRAEIYLPDKAVLGEGFQPVIVPKGSSGQVQLSDGRLRDTTQEDFLANNFPQSIGMRTDYYDRAMTLANEMKQFGLQAEYGGHSLAGGLASAMSAVTGQPATTFNAAGLHPNTAREFAARTPGAQVYDPGTLVRAYQVQGELLNDGIQNNVERMDVLRRNALAGALGEVAEVLRDVPAARSSLQKRVSDDPDMPRDAVEAVDAFIDRLATHDPRPMLEQLPLAAGHVVVLDAVKTWKDGKPVDRPSQLSLAEVGVLAAPLVEMAGVSLTGANLGRNVAEPVAWAMGGASAGLAAAGQTARAASGHVADFSNVVGSAGVDVVQSVVDVGGEGLARGREAAGVLEATVDHATAQMKRTLASGAGEGLDAIARTDWLPDVVQDLAAHGARTMAATAEAATRQGRDDVGDALGQAARDASAIRANAEARIVDLERVEVVANRSSRDLVQGLGATVDDVLVQASDGLRAGRDPVRDAGAAAGGIAGTGIYLAGRLSEASPGGMLNPAGWSFNAVKAMAGMEAGEDSLKVLANMTPLEASMRLSRDVVSTVELVRHAGASAGEAFNRHLMTDAVSPSMEARTDALEGQMRAKYPLPLQEMEKPIERKPTEASGPVLPESARQIHGAVRDAVGAAERALGKPWDDASDRLSASLALAGLQQGFSGQDQLQVGFNKATGSHAAGEYAFLFRTGPEASPDPAANRIAMTTTQALSRPAEAALQELQGFAQTSDTRQQEGLARQLQEQQVASRGPVIS